MAEHDQPFVGRVYFEVALAASPESPIDYTRVCEVQGISGLGETNDLVDVTTFCSGGNREYIGGLADGQEITLDANFIINSDGRRGLIAAQKAKKNVYCRVVADDNDDDAADIEFLFQATVLSWVLNPSVDDKNAIQFGLKISGEVEIVEIA